MAVGFENGNINLCTWVQDDNLPSSSQKAKTTTLVLPKGWLIDTTLIGAVPSKIDTLAFALCSSSESMHQQPRLFSTSGGSIVSEHFLPPHLLHMLRTGNGIYSSIASSSLSSKTTTAKSLTGTTRTISSQGGSVWCMSPSPTGRYLAIGCEDGHVRIVDIQDDRFELLAMSRSARRAGDGTIEGIANTLDRAKTRIVSLAWGPPIKRPRKRRPAVPTARRGSSASDSDDSDDDDVDQWEESFILGGTTHSSALVWTLSTGRIESKLLVDKSRNEQTIVWSAAVLRDGTLILGDSLGHVTFFDGKNRTMLPGCRFTRHGKGADVLTICVGSNGKTVYSAGLDQKVVEYASIGQGQQQKWISTGTRRLHAHDIRALAIEPPFSLSPKTKTPDIVDRVPVLVSGGSDFNLVFTPASPPSQLSELGTSVSGKKEKTKSVAKRQAIAQFDQVNPISTSPFTTFADTIQRRIPFVPPTGRGGSLGGGSVVRLCASKRWLLLRREKSVAIWQLPEYSVDGLQGSIADETDNPAWTKVVEMQVKLKTNLVCAELSSDGRFLAVGDLFETKLYRLESSGADVVPQKVKSFSKAFQGRGLPRCPGSSAIVFTPENTRLVLASHPGSFIHIVELPKSEDEETCKLVKTFDHHRKRVSGRAMAGRRGATSAKLTNGHASNNGTNGHLANGDGNFSSGAESSAEDQDNDEDEDEDAEGERTAFSRIDIVHTSHDGQYLISIDTSKRINVYSLDTLHYYRTLPSTSQVPTSVSFNRSDPSHLCLLLPTNQLVIYNLEERANEDQGRQDRSLESAIMEKIVTVRESAIGAIWLSSRQMLVWGSTWICSARLIHTASAANATTKRGRVGVAPESTSEGNRWSTSLTFKYQPLLHVGLLSEFGHSAKHEDELVVVERPYYDLARSLPPTWFSGASYGT
jgi:U3 small nucleolar RNA-associated protein 4